MQGGGGGGQWSNVWERRGSKSVQSLLFKAFHILELAERSL